MATPEPEPVRELVRVPFTPQMRRKVRGRLRGFRVGVAFVVLLVAGFQVLLSFADLSGVATLGFRLFFVVLALLILALIGFRARQEMRDLRSGYALRYEGAVTLSSFEPHAGSGSPQFYVTFPGKLLATTRTPFIAIAHRPDFVAGLPCVATVEFTPLAGDVLALITSEYGEVRA